MPTIAIVGAGPGLGLSIAKVFGRNGFRVALIARSQDKLDGLAAQLSDIGIDAAGFVADVMNRPSLAAAFARIKDRFSGIDVREYSPAPHTPVPGITTGTPLDATVDTLQPQIDYYLYGGITAAQQVLPDMIERGGTLLFTTGASSVAPVAFPAEYATVAIAASALRTWVLMLNRQLADTGVFAAHVALAVWIGSGGPETQADTIAQLYWDLHTKRDQVEHLYDPHALINVAM